MESRLLIVVLVTASTTILYRPASATDARLTPQQQEMQAAHDAYVACMKKNAIRLEPSGDTANDIAIAAQKKCEDREIDEMALSAAQGKSFTVEDMDRVNNDMRAEAITAVVEIRAARHKH